MAERLLPALKNRILQVLARIAPGATTVRVRLNRWRGVNIGKNVWIGYDAIIETSYPHLVTIRDRAAIGIRTTIIAHNREQRGVVIEEDVTLGPGVIVLPNVTIGRGAIVTAGSVVTKSVPPKTMVQGNPAQPIATVEIPFGLGVSLKEFAKGLRPIGWRSQSAKKKLAAETGGLFRKFDLRRHAQQITLREYHEFRDGAQCIVDTRNVVAGLRYGRKSFESIDAHERSEVTI